MLDGIGFDTAALDVVGSIPGFAVDELPVEDVADKTVVEHARSLFEGDDCRFRIECWPR